MLRKIIFTIIFYFISFNTLKAENKKFDINILAKIDNEIVTSYDLFLEKKTLELLNYSKINSSQHQFLLEQLINEKIKKIEIKKNNIEVERKKIEKKFKLITEKIKEENVPLEIKKIIKEKIVIDENWKKLIFIKYGNKIEINMNEIEDKFKLQKLDLEKRENIINFEKNQKMNVFSKTYFNEIKRKYLVQKY